MAFDRRAGGHAFSFDAGVCAKCEMTREYYEDNGKPRCTGRRAQSSRQRDNESSFVPEDE
jgi:hypothetical protein